ncbi:hypothetical protein BKA23_3372 [Rudaeicoccus suwonensis]|uniref:Uncharacterized protein n=1 Tax=Rudaeicoccus suwonensis TaxID=657409 RepID=A0A561DVH3_9MICO|nr:hypothetical protein BKA23_3372 [Rudaeicoccus suwonensis]
MKRLLAVAMIAAAAIVAVGPSSTVVAAERGHMVPARSCGWC